MRRIAAATVLAAMSGLLGTSCAPQLTAPPHLVASWPTSGAELRVAPHVFELTFNRALRAESTWAAVWRDDDGPPIRAETDLEPRNPRRISVRLLEPSAGLFRLHWHAVAARSGAVADGEQEFSMQDEAPANGAPHLQVIRSTAESGDRVQVVGRGFGQDCPVQLMIGDDEQPLSSARTDAVGGFAAEAQVPPSVAFGLQPVAAVDCEGDVATAALQVRWGGWPPLVAFTVGQPGPKIGEVTFSLSVRNRSDYVLEHVRVVMGDPHGASFVAAEPKPAREGSAVAWDVATLDRGVIGPFRATYRATSAVAMHARIEFRHRRPRGCNGDDCLPAFISETTSDSTPVYPAD